MGKCTPITQKAKSSPVPADANLIAGAEALGASTMQGDRGALITDKFNAAYNARKNNIITSFSDDVMPSNNDEPSNDDEPSNNNAPEEKENDDPNKQADNAIEPDEK